MYLLRGPLRLVGVIWVSGDLVGVAPSDSVVVCCCVVGVVDWATGRPVGTEAAWEVDNCVGVGGFPNIVVEYVPASMSQGS